LLNPNFQINLEENKTAIGLDLEPKGLSGQRNNKKGFKGPTEIIID